MKSEPLDNPLVWLCIICTAVLLLWLASHIMWLAVPLILAMLLYYLLDPLVDLIRSRSFTHGQAIGITLGAISLILLLLMPILAPVVSSRMHGWQAELNRYIGGGMHMVSLAVGSLENKFQWAREAELQLRWHQITSDFHANFSKKYLPAFLLEAAGAIPSMLIVPFIAFFMLRDGGIFKKNLMRIVPNAYFEKTLWLLYRMDHQIKQYFQGMLWWTLAVAAILGTGLVFIGLPNPYLLALAATVIAWVPYVGSVAGCLLIVLVAATDLPASPLAPYFVIGLFVTIRVLDDFLIIPHTLGKSMDIHPLPTVLLIFLGGQVGGPTGMFLAVPVLGLVMAAAEVIVSVLTDERLRLRHARTLRLRSEHMKQAME